MTQRFKGILWSTVLVGLFSAPLGVQARVPAPPVQPPQDTVTIADTGADPTTAISETAASDATSQQTAPQTTDSTPRGATLSPERFQDLQETLADIQTRLQGAVDAAGKAMTDGEMTVEVPAMLSPNQVQDLLDTVSQVRWTLNDAMDVAGDLAVQAGEPQGVTVTSPQMIGIAIGATGAAVIVDLLGGGGLATASAAMVGAIGGYWAGSQEAWLWTETSSGIPSVVEPSPAPVTN